MLAKKKLLKLLMQYKNLHPNETFDEEKLAHWINYQVCEEALSSKNSITVLSAALKVLEGKLIESDCLLISCISEGVFTISLVRNYEVISSTINLSRDDPLADLLVRLARELA